MSIKQFFVIVFSLFSLFSCKPDKEVSITDSDKIIGEWKREFVNGGLNNRLDTLKYGKDSVLVGDSKYYYVLSRGNIIHIDGLDTVFKVPYKFDGNDKFRTECFIQIGMICYFNLTKVK